MADINNLIKNHHKLLFEYIKKNEDYFSQKKIRIKIRKKIKNIKIYLISKNMDIGLIFCLIPTFYQMMN